MNSFLAGIHAVDSLTGRKTADQIRQEQTQATARASDAVVRLAQGVNNVPRALSGLLTAGQWHDTNPFEQANNVLNAQLQSGKQYAPNVVDSLLQWGLAETPQLLVGRGISNILGTPTGVSLDKGPRRFSHPAELWWNAAAEVGKGVTDPNLTVQDALVNGALNLVPVAGNTPAMRTALGLGSEALEVDNHAWGLEQ